MVVCGFGDLVDLGLRIWKMEFSFGYLWLYVCMFMSFVSVGFDLGICGFMFVSFICV